MCVCVYDDDTIGHCRIESKCWVEKSGLNNSFLKRTKTCLHFLLVSRVSDENEAVICHVFIVSFFLYYLFI